MTLALPSFAPMSYFVSRAAGGGGTPTAAHATVKCLWMATVHHVASARPLLHLVTLWRLRRQRWQRNRKTPSASTMPIAMFPALPSFAPTNSFASHAERVGGTPMGANA